MHDELLAEPKTLPCRDEDFKEWHRGIPLYGFWGIPVRSSGWLSLYREAREHVLHLIHPGYSRAPHITLFPCGLLSPEHFSEDTLCRQALLLRQSNIRPFSLRYTAISSFSTAPYLGVEDSEGGLKKIRELLAGISGEDHPPPAYTPHITLGFYKEAFDSAEVSDCLKKFKKKFSLSLEVRELCFCTYKTCEFQGPFRVARRIRLSPLAGS